MPALAAPSNDDRAQATGITAIPFEDIRDTSGATEEVDEPQPSCVPAGLAKATVWYQVTLLANTAVEAKTVGSKFDTVLAVYRNDSGTLSEIACNDDIEDLGSIQSRVNFPARVGSVYLVQVAGYDGAQGRMKLSVEGGTRAINDDFIDAEPLTALPYSTQVDLTTATVESTEPRGCGFYTMANTVWYSFTPDSPLGLRVSNGSVHTVVTAYTGSSLADLTQIACNHDSYPYVLHLQADANTTIYIQVGIHDYDTPRLTPIDFEVFVPPANDRFGDAIEMTGVGFHHETNTSGAGVENSEPDGRCTYGVAGATVWYKYTPKAIDPVVVTTRGSDYDTTVAIYEGTALSDLSEVACNDQAGMVSNQSMVGWIAEPGNTYYIQIGGWYSETGDLEVELRTGATIEWDEGGLTFGQVGADTNGSEVEAGAGSISFPGVGAGVQAGYDPESGETDATVCFVVVLIGGCEYIL